MTNTDILIVAVVIVGFGFILAFNISTFIFLRKYGKKKK
jgi:hypothetical protein